MTAAALNEILQSVEKKYECQICGTSYRTHRKAASCAEQCLAQKETAKVTRVE